MFSCELREISKNLFCIEHLPMTGSVVSEKFYKIFRIFFSKKYQRQLSVLIIFAKRMVFCYAQDIIGEFPLECKNDNNDNDDGKIKKLSCLRSS